jgi:putative Mg2+ transporter-C (MgtC) family protein
MEQEYSKITIHLLGALLAGGPIGLERSFHERPAGFRTHTLVCVTSNLLMLVTLYQWTWLPGAPLDTVKTDPTRMAQGTCLHKGVAKAPLCNARRQASIR